MLLTRPTQQPPITGTPRRTLLRAALAGTAATAGVTLAAPSAGAAVTRTRIARPATPDEALRELSEGNKRWRTFRQQHPHETETVRQALVTGQHPFAVILGCIDSRVAPELAFDQGLGDLMSVRSAGDVLDEAVLGSIAYGVLELGIPLVMVLATSRPAPSPRLSGRRTAAGGCRTTFSIWPIRSGPPSITPRAATRASTPPSAPMSRWSVSRLASEPDLAARVAEGKPAIVGARYELTTQLVRRID